MLGIDPGYGRMGYGVVYSLKGELTCPTYGCLETPASLPLAERLYAVGQAVTELIKTYAPDVVGIETLFFQKNVKTAIAVAEARGVILAACAAAAVPIIEVSPTHIKQALTSYGKAEKQQVQYMVRHILHFKEIPKPDDAADALAVALTVSSY